LIRKLFATRSATFLDMHLFETAAESDPRVSGHVWHLPAFSYFGQARILRHPDRYLMKLVILLNIQHLYCGFGDEFGKYFTYQSNRTVSIGERGLDSGSEERGCPFGHWP